MHQAAELHQVPCNLDLASRDRQGEAQAWDYRDLQQALVDQASQEHQVDFQAEEQDLQVSLLLDSHRQVALHVS